MSEQIRVAVIGTGFGARCQIPAFAAHPDTKLVAVASHSLERARIAAQTHGVPFYTDDYRVVFGRDDVDLVSITAPPHLHAPMTLAALKAGKHVICEKPMALNEREATRMANAARTARRVGLIDHEFRYLPERARLCELVSDGWLGDLQRIAWVETTSWMATGGDYRFGWQSQAKFGGGVLGALGSHAIDYCRLVAGEVCDVDASLATRVKRQPRANAGMADVDADDNASVRLTHAGGAISTIEICATAASGVSTIIVSGSKGVLRIDGDQLFGARGAHPAAPVTAPARTRKKFPPGSHRLLPAFYTFVGEAVAAVRGEPSTAATFADGARVQRVLDAARRSAHTGRAARIAVRKGKSV
ncbi:MAG TPA: Gfo/Idh/MocA family oxidoreductase [Candidatus Eremiobacteraceae bacterium]|nr:Gfo/Idh/MocA family oxidoreductase [Candidatus Eremiobacteraceae bacterium]